VRALLVAVAVLVVARPALAEDKKAAALHYKQGKVFFDAKDYERAIAEYKLAFDNDGKPAHLYNIARAYDLKRDPKSAIDYYNRVLVADPDSPTAPQVREFIRIATAAAAELDRKQREADEAKRRAEEQRKLAADKEQKRVAVTARIRQAKAYEQAGTWGPAGDEYRAAAELDGDPAHLLEAAEAYRKQPDNVKARDAYQRYLEKVPLGDQSDAVRGKVAEVTLAIEKADEEARVAKQREDALKQKVFAPPLPALHRHQSSHRGWIVVGGAMIITGLIADFAAPNANNGTLEASDFAGPALYGLGTAAVLRGVF